MPSATLDFKQPSELQYLQYLYEKSSILFIFAVISNLVSLSLSTISEIVLQQLLDKQTTSPKFFLSITVFQKFITLETVRLRKTNRLYLSFI